MLKPNLIVLNKSFIYYKVTILDFPLKFHESIFRLLAGIPNCTYPYTLLFFPQPIPIIRVTLPKLQFFIPVFLVMSIIYGNKFFIVILQFFFVLLIPYSYYT